MGKQKVLQCFGVAEFLGKVQSCRDHSGRLLSFWICCLIFFPFNLSPKCPEHLSFCSHLTYLILTRIPSNHQDVQDRSIFLSFLNVMPSAVGPDGLPRVWLRTCCRRYFSFWQIFRRPSFWTLCVTVDYIHIYIYIYIQYTHTHTYIYIYTYAVYKEEIYEHYSYQELGHFAAAPEPYWFGT